MRKEHCFSGAIACVGAVIGAGFASGREIMTFFSDYGVFSWGLILLSAGVMTLLCALCMRRAKGGSWCELITGGAPWVAPVTRGCVALLMAVIGGAMVSAAGHMTALLFPTNFAYAAGAVATLLMAWAMGFGSLRPFALLSGVLSAAFLLLILLLTAADTPQSYQTLADHPSPASLGLAALRAVAYASMNMTIAISMVCQCSNRSDKGCCRVSALFGLVMTLLLFLSNYLYLKHPELTGEPFPIVKLLSRFGRFGFISSIVLQYLAIWTTLIALICALRSVVEIPLKRGPLSSFFTLAPVLLFSMVGFTELVSRFYAPAGLVCLFLVFLPSACGKRGTAARSVDNPQL